MQNGPMINARAAAMQHLTTRAAGPHNVHTMGPRMQPSSMLQLPVAQGMPPGNTPFGAYSNPNVCKLIYLSYFNHIEKFVQCVFYNLYLVLKYWSFY